MSLNLEIWLLVITLIYMLGIIRAIQKKKLQITFSIFWILSGILLLVATLIPNFVENFAYWLGFETPANMLFCVTIFIAFYLIFCLTTRLSQENEKNIALTQEVSLLKEIDKEKENGKKE